jgi:hypothetical protein
MQQSIALPPGWETGPLAEELKTYQAHQADLLRQSPGKFVLVKGREIVGLYDREDEAFSEAYRRFRLSGFMIKQILEHEKVYTIGGSSFEWLATGDPDAAS